MGRLLGDTQLEGEGEEGCTAQVESDGEGVARGDRGRGGCTG